jgi:hypothetical protein
MNAADRIVKTLKGAGLLAELRGLIRSCDHLGFEVVEIEIRGGWEIRGALVSLGENIVGVPAKKFEIAPGVYALPTEFSTATITAERPLGHRPERDLYAETEPDRAGLGAGHRVELDEEGDVPPAQMPTPEELEIRLAPVMEED